MLIGPFHSPHDINILLKQECIPVGYVPAARRPYAGVCFPGGLPGLGGSAWSGGGVCLVPGGGGVCLVLEGLPGRGGLPGPGGRGICLVSGGSAWSGGLASQHALRQTPSPTSPVDRHTPVKTLPWPQLRYGR